MAAVSQTNPNQPQLLLTAPATGSFGVAATAAARAGAEPIQALAVLPPHVGGAATAEVAAPDNLERMVEMMNRTRTDYSNGDYSVREGRDQLRQALRSDKGFAMRIADFAAAGLTECVNEIRTHHPLFQPKKESFPFQGKIDTYFSSPEILERAFKTANFPLLDYALPLRQPSTSDMLIGWYFADAARSSHFDFCLKVVKRRDVYIDSGGRVGAIQAALNQTPQRLKELLDNFDLDRLQPDDLLSIAEHAVFHPDQHAALERILDLAIAQGKPVDLTKSPSRNGAFLWPAEMGYGRIMELLMTKGAPASSELRQEAFFKAIGDRYEYGFIPERTAAVRAILDKGAPLNLTPEKCGKALCEAAASYLDTAAQASSPDKWARMDQKYAIDTLADRKALFELLFDRMIRSADRGGLIQLGELFIRRGSVAELQKLLDRRILNSGDCEAFKPTLKAWLQNGPQKEAVTQICQMLRFNPAEL